MKSKHIVISLTIVLILFGCSNDPVTGTYAKEDAPYEWFDLRVRGKYTTLIGDLVLQGGYTASSDTIILDVGVIVGKISQEDYEALKGHHNLNLRNNKEKYIMKGDTLIDSHGVIWIRQKERVSLTFITFNGKIKKY
ncbi:MAG: hypothetical protein ABIE07_00990 [Candidatus Zixiibacteriota bacterium]